MKLRLGLDGSRFSTDLDLARSIGLDEFLTDFSHALRTGWAGFTGEIRPSRSVSRPSDVARDYVMTTRSIKVLTTAATTSRSSSRSALGVVPGLHVPLGDVRQGRSRRA